MRKWTRWKVLITIFMMIVLWFVNVSFGNENSRNILVFTSLEPVCAAMFKHSFYSSLSQKTKPTKESGEREKEKNTNWKLLLSANEKQENGNTLAHLSTNTNSTKLFSHNIYIWLTVNLKQTTKFHISIWLQKFPIL